MAEPETEASDIALRAAEVASDVTEADHPQERRRLVADALSTGRVTPWDIPGGYISTGDDFWTTIERARRS